LLCQIAQNVHPIDLRTAHQNHRHRPPAPHPIRKPGRVTSLSGPTVTSLSGVYTARPSPFAERDLWNMDRAAASVRLDVKGPDHLAPLLRFVRDELAKVGGRTDKRRGSHVGNARLHFGLGKGSVDLFVELVD